jgi:hypothetical protein
MENKTYQYYKELPSWAKGVVVVGGLGLVGYIGYSIYKKIQDKKAQEEANRQSNIARTEIINLENQGVRATHSDSEFEGYAQALVQAMNGCGTDEEAVYNVFKQMKNDVDIRKLVSTFGIRYYQPCEVSSPISYTRWLFNDQAFGGGISSWLNYDLTSSEIQTINSTLRTNGVNYSF